jgi:hypothetical protein
MTSSSQESWPEYAVRLTIVDPDVNLDMAEEPACIGLQDRNLIGK